MLYPSYFPANWYWAVGNQIFATARGVFVLADDADYLAWLETNSIADKETIDALAAELAFWRVKPVDPQVLAAYETAVIASDPVYPIIIDMQNQIDALKGTPPQGRDLLLRKII